MSKLKNELSIEEREEKSKIFNKIGLIILIVILCVCSFGFGYGSSASYIAKASTNKNASTEKGTVKCGANDSSLEILSTTDDEVLNVIDRISHADTYYCGVWDMYSTGDFSVNDFSNKVAFHTTLNYLRSRDGLKFDENYELTKDTFDKALAEIYGKDYKFTEYKDQPSCPAFTWNESKQAWIVGEHGCGGTCGPHNMKRVVKAYKTNNTMVLEVRVIFVDYHDTITYYKDVNHTLNITDKLNTYLEFGDSHTNDSASNYNLGSLYELTFKLEDGNYVFSSSKLVK